MQAISLPVIAMMLLTLMVWVLLYIRRISALKQLGVDPQSIKTPEALVAALDDFTNAPANCFRNMAEMPVIFYALCAFLAITGLVDTLYVNLAWAFVVFRVVQALIHCTYNKVMHRFAAYMVSCLMLWAMVIRFFLQQV